MINPRDNETRNKIMQQVKFEQEKRRDLHDFMRRAKEKILKESKDRREANLALAKLGSEGAMNDMPS